MKDDNEYLDGSERAESATYEDEVSTAKRTVTIPLKEYDEIKREEHFIKSQTLIDIIDNIERLVRALRKHIIRKWKKELVLWHPWEKIEENQIWLEELKN